MILVFFISIQFSLMRVSKEHFVVAKSGMIRVKRVQGGFMGISIILMFNFMEIGRLFFMMLFIIFTDFFLGVIYYQFMFLIFHTRSR